MPQHTGTGLLGPFVSYNENEVLKPYSQHFIFFVTYECAKQAEVFFPGKPFKLSVMIHSSLVDPFVNYKENGVEKTAPGAIT